jgi:hypothetical protein
MDRRRFLQTLLAGAVAAHELDVEKLLWVPGERKIFIPTLERRGPLVWRRLDVTSYGDQYRHYVMAFDYAPALAV